MTNNEKIPAQGGEMPPVERAAITGSGGIDTVRGATAAGNAAQARNTAAALTDEQRSRVEYALDYMGGSGFAPEADILRVLLTSPRAAIVPAGWNLLPSKLTEDMHTAAVRVIARSHGNDDWPPAVLQALIEAAPAVPIAEPTPDPLRRRVERLLVELHAEGRLSEGQCAKMLDIPRIDWRELAEFLSPDARAAAADGAPEDEPSEIEQVIACLGDDAAQLRDANPDDEMADNMESAARLLAERAAFDAWLADEFPDVAAAMKNEFTNPDVTESVDMARAAWDRASLGAAPAEAREPAIEKYLWELVDEARRWESAYRDSARRYETLDSEKKSVERTIRFIVGLFPTMVRPAIEYRYTGGTAWCDLGSAETMRPDFDGVYRLKVGEFPVWSGDVPADAGEAVALTAAARDVLAERARQMSVEGWTPEHDEQHDGGELASAAACYALNSAGWTPFTVNEFWPPHWLRKWWKPTTPRRDCVKAAALLIAEIERIDRSEAAQGAQGGKGGEA